MIRPFSLFVGWRYVRSVQSERVLNLYAFISIIGIALGVAVLIIVLSVLNGFEREFKQRILGLVPSVKVYGGQDWQTWESVGAQLMQMDEVLNFSPFIEVPGMLMVGDKAQTVYMAGIDPAMERNMSVVASEVFDQYQIEQGFSVHKNGVFLGRLLAQELGVEAGDTLTVMYSDMSQGRGRILPESVIVHVAGIVDTNTELDRYLAMIHLNFAREILNQKGVMGMKLKLVDPMQAPQLLPELKQQIFERYYWLDWTSTHGNLYHAIQLPRRIMWVLLVFILMVATFNMTTTLYMMVSQKQMDLAVLRTLGATTRQIAGSFVVQGLSVGTIGVVVGTVLGVAASVALPNVVLWIEAVFGVVLFQGESYFIQFIPSEVGVFDIIGIVMVAISLCLVSTLLPSLWASRLEPVDILRGET